MGDDDHLIMRLMGPLPPRRGRMPRRCRL